MFEEDDGLTIADGRFQKTFRIGRRCRCYNLDARNMADHRIEALGVLGTGADPTTTLRAQNKGNIDLPFPEIGEDGCLVDERVERQWQEVGIHDLEDGAGSGHGGRHGHRRQRLLGNRRVADARIAKFVSQTLETLNTPP